MFRNEVTGKEINTMYHQEPMTMAETFEQYVQTGDALYHSHLDIKNPFNRLEQALDEYAKALELAPDSPSLLGKVARVLLRKGEYERAEKTALKALSKHPCVPDALYVLGYIRYKENAMAESAAYLKKALRYSGLNSSRYRFCMFYTCAALARKTKNPFVTLWQWFAALYYFASAVLFSPLDREPAQFFNVIAILPSLLKAYLKEQAGDRDGAMTVYQGLHERFLGFPPVMNLISALYQRKGMYDEAIDWVNKAIARDPLNEEGYFQLAGMLEQLNEHRQGRALYKRLLSLRPHDPQIHCSLGNLHSVMNDTDEAISHYKAAFQLSADPAWKALISQTLGGLYQDVKHNAEAAQLAFQTAIELNPTESCNYIQLGILYFESGDYTNAEIIYEQALKIRPDSARIHSNLGYLKWLKGNIGEAVQHYDTAIDLDPLYDIPYNNLGVIHLDIIGNIPRAIELIEKAAELNEHYALAFYNLGRAYMFVGQRLEAAQCFQKAQHLNEYTKELDNDELNERLNSLFNTFEN
jgi:tetratricopeptide (TPR) repeat protein